MLQPGPPNLYFHNNTDPSTEAAAPNPNELNF